MTPEEEVEFSMTVVAITSAFMKGKAPSQETMVRVLLTLGYEVADEFGLDPAPLLAEGQAFNASVKAGYS